MPIQSARRLVIVTPTRNESGKTQLALTFKPKILSKKKEKKERRLRNTLKGVGHFLTHCYDARGQRPHFLVSLLVRGNLVRS